MFHQDQVSSGKVITSARIFEIHLSGYWRENPLLGAITDLPD